MQILKGNTSGDTAYVVEDYPYGFRLRCKIRYWLEFHPKRGVRFMSQTTNPKRGNVWNKAKASTYYRFGACMYLDEKGHVNWIGLSEYSDGKEAAAFLETYGEGVPEAAQPLLRKWTAAKVAYDAKRDSAEDRLVLPLNVGLAEAGRAFAETA